MWLHEGLSSFFYNLMCFLVKDHECWRPKGWQCWKTDTPHSLAINFYRVSFSSIGSSAGKRAAYTSRKGNFHTMPSLNASREGFQVPTWDPLGSFYHGSHHHSTLVSPGGAKLGLSGCGTNKFLSPAWIQNSQQQNNCHTCKTSLEITFCVKKRYWPN